MFCDWWPLNGLLPNILNTFTPPCSFAGLIIRGRAVAIVERPPILAPSFEALALDLHLHRWRRAHQLESQGQYVGVSGFELLHL